MLIGYCRISTASQDDGLQLDAMSKAGVTKIFREVASGARANRPQLQAAIDYARSGDTIVAYKLDRLGRSTRNLLELVEVLDAKGVHLRSLLENLDTNSAAGRLIFSTFAAMSEFERDVIRERTRDGLQAARSRGRIGGRPKAMSAVQAEAASALLRGTSMSMHDVAAHFGVSVSTIYRHCKNGPVLTP